MSAPHPPRKGAYTKHVSALHKDQFIRIQAKNSQELELLDQMHSYMKKRTAIERKSAEEMLKLNTAYLNHKIIPIWRVCWNKYKKIEKTGKNYLNKSKQVKLMVYVTDVTKILKQYILSLPEFQEPAFYSKPSFFFIIYF